MKYIKRILLACFLLTSIAIYSPIEAQCPMCRLSAENNLKEGGNAGKGLNAGILFLLSTPYILIGSLGFIYWKNRQKEKAVD